VRQTPENPAIGAGAPIALTALMSRAWLAVLSLMWGCGGTGASAEPADASPAGDAPADASAQSEVLYRYLYMQEEPVDGQAALTSQCLLGPLPVDPHGIPNCVVVSAIVPATHSEEAIAACNKCDAPGLEPFVAPAPLESIGEGLSNYACLCAVKPRPEVGCDSFGDDDAIASWCYSKGGDPSGACAQPPGPFLSYSPTTLMSGTVYVACFSASAAP
jgi:hypothetical protein